MPTRSKIEIPITEKKAVSKEDTKFDASIPVVEYIVSICKGNLKK